MASLKQLTGSRRVMRLAALAPLGVISTAWTLSVAGAGALPATSAARAEAPEPPVVAVPAEDVDTPASLSRSGAVPATVGRGVRTVATSSATAIPSPALAAYQRAATIIRNADDACGLEWPLIAAIGAIESRHGTVGGSTLRSDGVAVPAIVGMRLDGRHGTADISDTDGGRYDGDPTFDRAVGPMQFIPTTWGIVGVDADNDGRRNPQDVDDAALAAAVYLCSGDADLSDPTGMRRAVLRYNHSASYADSVLTLARSYAAEGFVPLAAGLAVHPEGAMVADGSPVREARGGTVRGIRAAAQSEPTRQPAPKPAGGRPSTGGTGGGEEPPAPKPTGTPLSPVTNTLECTLTSLDRILQPEALTTCLAKLGQ